jgi:hypothetical protein
MDGHGHGKSPHRHNRLWLINAFAAVLLTLLGAASEALGYDRMLKTNTVKRHIHSLFREEASPEANPTAAMIDVQSVKSAKKGDAHIDPYGYDAGKKVERKKQHILVDTGDLLLHAIVTAADIQDGGGGAWLLGTLFGLYLPLLKLCADGGYHASEFRASVKSVLSQVDV